MKLAILIACHNRRAKTLACLDAVFKNQLHKGIDIHVILFDDGSTDGTEAAVQKRFPFVEILRGDGKQYWNRSMHLAFSRAIELDFDCYLWLNDDTILYPKAIKSMISTWRTKRESDGRTGIVVGSTQDPETGILTYGGVIAKDNALRPLNFTLVSPQLVPVRCHSMNGNCVLISAEVVEVIGGNEPSYAHAFGDIDYGLRARNAGFKLWVAPEYIGKCSRNSIEDTFNDRTLPLSIRWKKMMQPKGLPPASWLLFTRRHCGVFWPVYFIWPYLKLIFR